jgi:hypothetical protein
MAPIGAVFLGMPNGFSRLGSFDSMCLSIFPSFEAFEKDYSTPAIHGPSDGYNMWNVPVWKFLDEHGNTIVRGISPRINKPFLHVILENCLDKIDCLEITKEVQEKMN